MTWANALKRWGLPPADLEPLVVGEMELPLVWRAFLVVGATEPLGRQAYGKRSPPRGLLSWICRLSRARLRRTSLAALLGG